MVVYACNPSSWEANHVTQQDHASKFKTKTKQQKILPKSAWCKQNIISTYTKDSYELWLPGASLCLPTNLEYDLRSSSMPCSFRLYIHFPDHCLNWPASLWLSTHPYSRTATVSRDRKGHCAIPSQDTDNANPEKSLQVSKTDNDNNKTFTDRKFMKFPNNIQFHSRYICQMSNIRY